MWNYYLTGCMVYSYSFNALFIKENNVAFIIIVFLTWMGKVKTWHSGNGAWFAYIEEQVLGTWSHSWQNPLFQICIVFVKHDYLFLKLKYSNIIHSHYVFILQSKTNSRVFQLRQTCTNNCMSRAFINETLFTKLQTFSPYLYKDSKYSPTGSFISSICNYKINIYIYILRLKCLLTTLVKYIACTHHS